MADRTLFDRVRDRAHDRPHRVRGRNPWVLAVDLAHNTVEDRVTGLAAEMAFWALLSFFPLVISISALLGYAEALVGTAELQRGQDAIVGALSVVFNPELTEEVVDPFIGGLLRAEQGGLAATSLVVTLYLASRVFTATIRSLDLAYRVAEARGLLAQRLLAVAFALGFVVVVVATLLLMVLGPLLGTGESVAERLGLGDVFAFLWSVFRWPVLLAIMVAFLSAVYRYGPNVENRWRHCLPGALLGVVLWTLASVGLRLYLEAGGGAAPQVEASDEAVALVGRVVGTLLALMLWVFLTGFAILVGGELNALLAPRQVRRGGVQPAEAPGAIHD
ncbi:MAG: hypothetical protein GEU74_00060 [Nitriliruptorales bacterium]|nr:hypothetical protein [Nitriliruptorales bacterium]